jgi:hypothetical protein
MSRRMSPASEKEFAELLGFIDLYMQVAVPQPVPEDIHPRFVAERIAQEHGRSRALEGARDAANDLIGQLTRLTPEGVRAFDYALESQCLPTLSELRRRYSAAYRQILRRNCIKTETEYYMVKNVVDDLTSKVSAKERDALVAMMEAYEG